MSEGYGLLAFIVVLFLISGFIGLVLATWKSRGAGEGFLLGFFLGPFGWIIEAVQPSIPLSREACPHCREMMIHRANVCCYCGREVERKKAPTDDRIFKLGDGS